MSEAAHPLAHVFKLVAGRERRFDPFRTSGRFRSIVELQAKVRGAADADAADGLARRIAGLSLAYRLGAIAAPAITALAATRRLPDLSAGNVLVDDGAGARIERFSLRSLRFFCLPDDPDLEHRDAIVVDTPETLRERFDALYTRAWLADFIAAIERSSPLNEKALWGMVASGWASSAGHVAAATGDPGRAIADVDALLDRERRARRSPLAFYVDDRTARAAVRHWRGVCCLAYTVAGKDMCEGECPLLPEGRFALHGETRLS